MLGLWCFLCYNKKRLKRGGGMDYYQLTKEALVHELKKLQKALEKEQMNKRALDMGIAGVLNTIEVPIYSVGEDYNILWANDYAIDHFGDIYDKKCYKVFFNRGDMCPGCLISRPVKVSEIHTVSFKTTEGGFEIKQLPMSKENHQGLVLEYIGSTYMKESRESALKAQIEKTKKEKKQLEEELLKSQRAFHQFVDMVKTPLRSFLGYFQLDEKQSQKYKPTMDKASQQVFELFSRMSLLTSEKKMLTQLESMPFNIKKEVKHIVNQFKIDGHSNEISYQTRFKASPHLPELVYGKKTTFVMMVHHFLTWILWKSSYQSLIIEVNDIQQDEESVSTKILIKSYGVKKYILHQKPYDKSMGEYSGKLAYETAMNLADAMDAIVDLTEGVGGDITLQLSMPFKKLRAQENTAEYPKSQDRMRVLIIDNDRPRLDMKMFEQYDLFFAKTGDEGLASLKKENQDIVLINVAVESCDGFSFFDQVEKMGMKKVKIVAMSQQLIENEMIFMKDYGFDSYVSKPLNSEKLEGIIYQLSQEF